MVNTELHQHGEEFMQEQFIDSGFTVSIGLYNDTTDALTDESDVGDITTEPSGSAYARQEDLTGEFTASLVGGDVQIAGESNTFDVSDSSQDVDSVFTVISFASDVVSSDGGTATEHLIFTNALDQSYDLSQFDSTVDLDPVKLTLS